jgi:preprotein translocase subunit YajC
VAAVDLIPFVLILLAFYLLIIRPARNRQRAAQELQQRLEPGVEVMTTSGIYGTVVAIDEESVSIEVAPGTAVRFAKAAVAQVRGPETADDRRDDDAVSDDTGRLSGDESADPTRTSDLDTDPRGDHTAR